MWKSDNGPCCQVLESLIADNEKRPLAQRVRVVSISTGMFSQWSDFDRWQATLKRAAEQGILVLTCDQSGFKHGMLSLAPGNDPDDPASYRSGAYGDGPGALLVPAGNRTTASHSGPEVYTYWVRVGMSWATPYVAGVAALAFQAKTDLKPDEVLEWLHSTATKTDAGLVVNPAALIREARKPRN